MQIETVGEPRLVISLVPRLEAGSGSMVRESSKAIDNYRWFRGARLHHDRIAVTGRTCARRARFPGRVRFAHSGCSAPARARAAVRAPRVEHYIRAGM